MKLLISAYACRPNMGSEPAVGWNWILELSKYHQLTVLTNFTNQSHIEEFERYNGKIPNIHFVYVRPNKKFTFWYKEWQRFERIYYFMWQKKALRVATELSRNERFDAVQHLTYVTCIMPTYMYKLNIPFIYGPISGGERIPGVIKLPMTGKEKLIEVIRQLTLLIPKISVNTRRAFRHADKIIVVTNDTKRLIPKKYKSKIIVCQAISLSDSYFNTLVPQKHNSKNVKILIAGRMLAWKGFNLGIDAVIEALNKGAHIDLTILGAEDNNFCNYLKSKAGSYLGNQIHFVKRIAYDKMTDFYDQFDILLNCSLRDSGCLVVMEGMGRGLPVICVNTGGPAVNTDNTCAIKINPAPYKRLVSELAEAIIFLSANEDIRYRMSENAREFAQTHFTSAAKIKNFLHVYEEVISRDK